MKVSEITAQDVADYIKESNYNSTDTFGIPEMLAVAKAFIESYTGIPQTSDDETVKTLDDYEDFYIVVMVLCSDMYDNRSLYIDKNNLNKVVDTILGMHCNNLLR